MTELQYKLLEMFKWFHSFCVENELKYYALGGTMLGTIRHKGFIPWDDDIDVGMPREDYERFLKIYDNVDKRYIVESPESGNIDFLYGYAKLYDTRTTLVEKARINIKRGIYIDIFPLDGVANDIKEARKYFVPIDFMYKFFVARNCAILSRRSCVKNIVAIVARLIPGVNNQKIVRRINKLCKRKSYRECEFIGNLMGNWGLKEIMPKNYMGRPTLYDFESIKIYGVEKPDKYLTSLYGEWNSLPPEEQRVSKHDYELLDLNTPF